MTLLPFGFEEFGDGIAFTRQQAEGAMPNGARVAKRNSESGDVQPDGARGTIIGSIGSPTLAVPGFPGQHYAYCVIWDGLRVPIFVMERKLTKL